MTDPRTWMALVNEDALMADGFEDAFVGFAERCSQPLLAVYDYEKCIEILMAGGMDHGEAEEYFEFNVTGAWVGENTPLFLTRFDPGYPT